MMLATMKRLLTLLISAALFVGVAPALPPWPQATSKQSDQKKDAMVYVTRTGKRYHRAGCSSLRKLQHPDLVKGRQGEGLRRLQDVSSASINATGRCSGPRRRR